MTGSRTDSDDAVMDKFGVRAGQIVDYLALMGDAVDNVPGVEKCGPKTAAKWLAEYNDLDGVIAAAATMKGKIGENLRAALPRLPLNRDLVTIRTDVELEQGPRDLRLRDQHVDSLRELYGRYGFTQALRELGGVEAPAAAGEAKVSLRGTAAGFARSSEGVPAVETDPALAGKGEY
ncbi:MAG TPA: DNA polymerase I, partial [Stenotrophomonas sp.]|nr:DNA polymerase I [Stenotrophomonas sp.]